MPDPYIIAAYCCMFIALTLVGSLVVAALLVLTGWGYDRWASRRARARVLQIEIAGGSPVHPHFSRHRRLP